MTQHPRAELSAYIDKALDPAAQAAVEGHLVTCALCSAHVAQLRATASFVNALPDPVPSRRLVPRFAPAAPAWLAPLRTLMTIASGAAVFLFIASALVTNITFLAGSGAATTAFTAPEAARDVAANAPSKALQPASSAVPAPDPAPVPSQAGLAAGQTANPDLVRGPAGASGPTDDAKVRTDQATAGPSGAPPAAAFNPQDTGRLTFAEPQRSPLLNPWLWLGIAIVCAAVAVALQRRLRSSI